MYVFVCLNCQFYEGFFLYLFIYVNLCLTYSKMIVKEEKVGLASSCAEEGSSISCSRFEFCCPNSFRTANETSHIKVQAVTHSSPSPIIYCIESVPQDAHISHIEIANPEDGTSNSSKGASPSVVLRDVHISARLMEDFLELAKENTEKDLETCGILGASLLKIFLFPLCRKRIYSM